MRKAIASSFIAFAFVQSAACKPPAGNDAEGKTLKSPKPRTIPLPAGYESKSACEKMDLMWNERILPTRYPAQGRPEIPGADGLGLIWQTLVRSLAMKMDAARDDAPEGWSKPIHRRGSVAKAAFVAAPDNAYTGLFAGVPCGLLRLSLTSNPKDDQYNPGLAWKALIDARPSENISALVSLDGQGKSFNFFENNFSNVVPGSHKLSLKITKAAFSTVSKHPHKIDAAHFSEVTHAGARVDAGKAKAPSQVIFVPDAALRGKFPSSPARDFRDDLETKIPSGTTLFHLYGVDGVVGDADWGRLMRAGGGVEIPSDWKKIGSIVSASAFVSSEWGDDGIFFRHHRFRNE